MPAWLQRDWCSSFVLALGHFLWQGTLFAIVLAIALRSTKTVSVRYWLSLAALLLMAACPVVTLGWLMQPISSVNSPGPSLPNSKLAGQVAESAKTLDLPILNFEDLTPASRDAASLENTPVAKPLAAAAPLVPTTELPTGTDWRRFAPLLTSLYLSGVALMWLRLAIGLWGGRRLRRQATPATDSSLLSALQRQADALGLKLRPVLAFCERVTVPTVVGILKPMILLPLSLANGLSPEQIESVLAHELAHLRRYDHLVNLLQRIIESLLFAHPAVWWVSHRIRKEREHCCDDLVVACGAMPLDYAKSLLRVAELSQKSRLRRSVSAVSLLATGDKPSNLRQRIARLLGESATPSLRVSPRSLLLAIGIPVVAVIATIQSGASPPPPSLKLDVETRAGRGSPDPVLDPTAGLPNSDEETSPTNNANGDQRSNPAAGSGDPHRAQDAQKRSPNPLVAVLQPAAKDARIDAVDDAMPLGMVQRLGSARFKVPGSHRRLAFAGNDEWVWVEADGRLAVIHRETGRVVKHHQLQLGDGSVRSLAVSADGTRVAIGMLEPPFLNDDPHPKGYRVVVMSALTTAHLQEMRWKGPPDNLPCLSFSGDGSTLLTATQNGNVRLWDVETGKSLRQQTFEEGASLHHAALSPDGRSALLSGWNESYLWKHADNVAPIVLAKPPGDATNFAASFAPNGRLFCTIWPDGPRLWDAATCELIAHLKSNASEKHVEAEFSHAFAPDSRVLAVSISTSDRVELWDVESKQRLATLAVDQPREVAISRNGRWLAVSGYDFATTIFDLKTRKQVSQSGEGHGQEIRSLRFADAGSVVTLSDGDARVWDITSGKPQRTLTHDHKSKMVRGLATSPDGTLLVTSGLDDTLAVWERATGKRLFTLKGHGEYGGVRAVQFNRDGTEFVSWGDNGVLRTWNPKDGRLLSAQMLDVPVYKYDETGRDPFSAFGLTAAFGSDARSLFIAHGGLFEFDTRTGRRLRDIPMAHAVDALAISSDGRWLTTAEQEHDMKGNDLATNVVLRDRATLKIIRQWPVTEPRDAPVTSNTSNEDDSGIREKDGNQTRKNRLPAVARGWQAMSVSPDSTRLAWSRIGTRSAIDIADLTNDRLVASIPVESPCWCLEFSPEGTHIASGHQDSTASVWDLTHPTFIVGKKRLPAVQGEYYDANKPLDAIKRIRPTSGKVSPAFTGSKSVGVDATTPFAKPQGVPPDGLEFLKPYPKLHGLSLDMTEPQFLEIVKQQELKTRKTVDDGKVAHHIPLGDGHTLVVMFDKDAKCSGIQRVRGDDAVPVRPSAELGRESFKGRVMVVGPRPKLPLLTIRGPGSRDGQAGRELGRVPDESLLISEEGGLANAVVYLRKAPADWKPTDPPREPVVLKSEDNYFRPRMSLIRVGQPLRLHAPTKMADYEDFSARPMRSNPFQIVVQSKDSIEFRSPPFTASEPLPVKVESQVHQGRQAWLLPLDHPFAAITDTEGRFEITGLPPGDYEFRVWHESGGGVYLERKLPVRVTSGQATDVSLKYKYEGETLTASTLPLPQLAPIASFRAERQQANDREAAKKLVGLWKVTMPAGFIFNAEFTQSVDGCLKLSNARLFSGKYAVKGNRVELAEYIDFSSPGSAVHVDFVWEVQTDGSLKLIVAKNPAGNYLGAVLERVPADVPKKDADARADAFEIPQETVRWAKELAVAESKQRGDLKSRRPKGLEDLATPQAIEQAWQQALRDLGNDYDSSGDARTRMRYLGDTIFDQLVKVAKSDDAIGAGRACQVLGYRGAKAVAPLSDVLKTSVHEVVRSAAADALGQTFQPASVPALIQALDDKPGVRHSAIFALQYLRDKRAVEPLKKYLADASSAHIASTALKHIDEPQYYAYWPPELLDHWQLCQDAQTLAGERFGPAEFDRLLKHIQSEHWAVASASLHALGHLHVTSVVPAIRKLKNNSSSTYALAQLATPEAIDELVTRMTSGSQDERNVSLQMVAEGAGRWAAPLLFALLDDDSLKVAARTDKFGEQKIEWPQSHRAHTALYLFFFRFGHSGEQRNLYLGQTTNVPDEMARLRGWWKQHGRDFVAGDKTPNPNLSQVGYNH